MSGSNVAQYFQLILVLFLSMSLIARGIERSFYEAIVPKGYDANILPLQPEDKPTPVYIALEIVEIDEILEDKMEFSVQLFVSDIWRDPRLNFTNIINKHPVTSLPGYMTEKIWMPDLVFDNSKYGYLHDIFKPNIFLRIYPAKFIVRTSRYSIKATCRMKLNSYPMDVQKCHLGITTLFNSDQWLHLKWCETDEEIKKSGFKNAWIDPDLQTVKYYVKSYSVNKRTQAMIDGNFTSLKINFTFVRHLSRHLSNVYIPSGLIVLLSFISFWLHPSAAPARVALGLTSLLTLVTQAFQAQSSLPPINYMTAMDIWFFVCIVMVFFSLVEYACVYNLGQRKEVKPTSKLVNASYPTVFPSGMNHQIRRRHTNFRVCHFLKKFQRGEREASAYGIRVPVHYFDKISRLFFPMLFTIFVFSYFVHYENK